MCYRKFMNDSHGRIVFVRLVELVVFILIFVSRALGYLIRRSFQLLLLTERSSIGPGVWRASMIIGDRHYRPHAWVPRLILIDDDVRDK